MHVSVETLGKFERKLTVSLPQAALEQRVRDRVQELSRTMRLKGFRPGKVPVRVVEQRYGGQIRDEELSELVRDAFNRAVEQEQLRLAVPPRVDTPRVETDQPIEFVAHFDVLPDMPSVDVNSLEIERVDSEIGDSDIDAMIKTLREQRKNWLDVDAAAEDGDLVLFEFSAEYEGGRYPTEEGREGMGTVLGSGILSEDLEKALLGLAPGAETSGEMSFPDPFRVEELAGKSAKVELKVVTVKRATLPEVDEAFMAQFGIVEGGMERFREEVRANLEREMRSSLMSRLKSEVADKLVAAHDVELPQSMVDGEARAMFQRAQRRQSNEQPVQQPSEEQMESLRPMARKRVLAGLLMSEVARSNKLSVDQRRVAEAVATIASTYEQPEQVFQMYMKDAELLSAVQGQVMEDVVVEWVAENAKTTRSSVPFTDLMKAGATA